VSTRGGLADGGEHLEGDPVGAVGGEAGARQLGDGADEGGEGLVWVVAVDDLLEDLEVAAVEEQAGEVAQALAQLALGEDAALGDVL
jgi:hypothetical protein